jgi:LuxR family transcriptional regulator, maltose regulon positive regulatory protein
VKVVSLPDPAVPARTSSSVRLERVRPPTLVSGTVYRGALNQWLARAWAAPTSVIQAPAGYGKTTVLAQFHQALLRSGRLAYWLSVGAGDREPDALLAALAAS